MITIAGGTGRVGAKVVAELAGSDRQVRVLTRDPAGAREKLGGADVELIRVDFDNPATLASGLAGSEAALISLGTSERQLRDEIALVDAAVAAEVGFLVDISSGGAQQGIANPVLELHSEIDLHVQAQDVPWALLRPATFTDAIVDIAAGLFKAGAWGGHAAAGRASFIDTRDVARAAARILLEGADAHHGTIYDLSGPEAITMHQLAALLSDAVGHPVTYVDRTREEQREVLESLGMPPLRVEVLLGLDDLIRDDLFATPTTTLRELTGRTGRPVADYADAHIDTFAPQPVG